MVWLVAFLIRQVLTMRDLFHFYHVYADPAGLWHEVVNDHFEACEKSGLLDVLSGPVRIGVVGAQKDRYAVYAQLDRGFRDDYRIKGSAVEGFEQVTLFPLWCEMGGLTNGAVLYSHTKGVAHPSVRQDDWRRKMTAEVVGRWDRCAAILDIGAADLVGSYRIVNDGEAQAAFGDGADAVAAGLNAELGIDLPVGPVFPEVGQSIYAGNFWWATSQWVASLDAPAVRSRYDAETWIGGPNQDGVLPTNYNLAEWIT